VGANPIARSPSPTHDGLGFLLSARYAANCAPLGRIDHHG
jgi:hypothetical protein